MDTTLVPAAGFLGLIPDALYKPGTFIVILLLVIGLSVFALYKNKNIKLSIFGKPIFDIEAKEVECLNKISVNKIESDKVSIEGKMKNTEDEKETALGKKASKQKPPPHAGCPHVNDFILVIRETTTVVSKISEMKFKGCMSEQLYKADQHLMRFRALYQKAYRRTMKDLKVPNEDTVRSYKFYQLFVKVMLEDIKDEVIRSAFLNNHLADFEMDRYMEYIDNAFEAIKNVLDDGVNDMYIGEWPVSQSKLQEAHHSVEKEAKEVIKEIFLDARDIAIRTRERIQKLETDLKEFVARISGIDK